MEKFKPACTHRIQISGTRPLLFRTGLTTVCDRQVGITMYDQVLGIRNDLHKNEEAIETQLKETASSIGQQIDNVHRIESDDAAGHRIALASLQTLVEPMHSDQATMMGKVDHLLAITKVNEGYLQSINTFQTTSLDILSRIVRAELRTSVISVVEEYLNPYKSNHNAQMEEVRKSLDQIMLAFGHLSVNDLAAKKEKKSFKDSPVNFGVQELQRDAFPHQKPSGETEERFSDISSGCNLNNVLAVQAWTQLWAQTFIFHWRMGELIVHVRKSQYQYPVRPEGFQAFEGRKATFRRYSYVFLVEFRPTPSLRLSRGVSIRYSSRHNQRGFYQICPMITTFAIVPDESEVFNCVYNRDLAGLKVLFGTGNAAPTDRTEDMTSLLHVSILLTGSLGKFEAESNR